jgi:hypothetical protein
MKKTAAEYESLALERLAQMDSSPDGGRMRHAIHLETYASLAIAANLDNVREEIHTLGRYYISRKIP